MFKNNPLEIKIIHIFKSWDHFVISMEYKSICKYLKLRQTVQYLPLLLRTFVVRNIQYWTWNHWDKKHANAKTNIGTIVIHSRLLNLSDRVVFAWTLLQGCCWDDGRLSFTFFKAELLFFPLTFFFRCSLIGGFYCKCLVTDISSVGVHLFLQKLLVQRIR